MELTRQVDIAQLEERKIVALEVVGSKPTFHTTFCLLFLADF